MTELLKKGVKYNWDAKCDEAFHTLREHLTTTPVLAQPDNSKTYDVYMHWVLVLAVFLCKKIEFLCMLPELSDLMKSIIQLMILS